jgi:hypothetical protein
MSNSTPPGDEPNKKTSIDTEEWERSITSIKILHEMEYDDMYIRLKGNKGNIYMDGSPLKGKSSIGDGQDELDITEFAGLMKLVEEDINETVESDADEEKKKETIRYKVMIGIKQLLPTATVEAEYSRSK